MTKKEHLKQQYSDKYDFCGEKLNIGDEVAVHWIGAQLRKGIIVDFCRKVVMVKVPTTVPKYDCVLQKAPNYLIKINTDKYGNGNK